MSLPGPLASLLQDLQDLPLAKLSRSLQPLAFSLGTPEGLPRAVALLAALFEPLLPTQVPSVACSGSLLFDLAILEDNAVVPLTIPSDDDHSPLFRDKQFDNTNG